MLEEDFGPLLSSELLDDEYLLRAFHLTRAQRGEFAARYRQIAPEGRPKLSPFFDPAWYVATYEDVRRAEADAFLHFIVHGVLELRSPHPLICLPRIYDDNREIFYREGGCRSLLRVLSENLSNPNDYFDVQYYLTRYEPARACRGGALRHFVEMGASEQLCPNPFFDPEWYAAHNPGVPQDSLGALRHFLETGDRLGLQPGPDFDPQWYLYAYPEVLDSGKPALAHFLCEGRRDGRQPRDPDAGRASSPRRPQPDALAAPDGSELPIAGGPRSVALVLGVHRSGTSLCSHILSALGIDMGDTVEPVASNRGGQWERADLRRLQDRVLESFGRGYHTPMSPLENARHDLPLPSGWREDRRVVEIGYEIRAALRRNLRRDQTFGFKDPRTARLLPMWLDIFGQLELVPKPVLCLRNPVEVARSLAARDGVDPELGEYRWFVYMMDAFGGLRELDVCVLEYETWFSDPVSNLNKLTKFFGIAEQGSAPDLIARIDAIVDRGLRHDEGQPSQPRHPIIREAYEFARRFTEDPAARQAIGRMVDGFASYQELRRPADRAIDGAFSHFGPKPAAGQPQLNSESTPRELLSTLGA